MTDKTKDHDFFGYPPHVITAGWVREAVSRIKASSEDDEKAHLYEDELHRIVLQSIANYHCDHPPLCARLALETIKLEFTRHCA